MFCGTDKRWYTAELCHPFLAIAQAVHANPLWLVDEIEKAGTRTDYGRLWDCIPGVDPALQINLDLSHVSYIATANDLDPLPLPLRDRFRVIAFSEADRRRSRRAAPGGDCRVGQGTPSPQPIPPLDAIERSAAAANWRGAPPAACCRSILRERYLRAFRN